MRVISGIVIGLSWIVDAARLRTQQDGRRAGDMEM
jgi:hypothetical protein